MWLILSLEGRKRDSYLLNELSLFSGYGGFILGLRLAGLLVRTVGYVEIESYCQEIIKARIRDGFLDDAPIFGDIRLALSTSQLHQFRGLVNIVTAGFPCQPHSHAGRRKGADDSRNLWPETLECVRQVAPHYVLLENVPGILSNQYAGTVIGQLAEIGYDCIWDCIPAASAGAPHLRWRWWCMAYTKGMDGKRSYAQEQHIYQHDRVSSNDSVANKYNEIGKWPPLVGDIAGWDRVLERQPQLTPIFPRTFPFKSDVHGVADGVAHRVDRLKAIGNGIVPAVVAKFLKGE